MKINAIKRRYGKGVQICKRVIVPCIVLYFVFYFFSSTSEPLQMPQDNFIVPGEVLDPIVKGKHNPDYPAKNFDSVKKEKIVLPQPDNLFEKINTVTRESNKPAIAPTPPPSSVRESSVHFGQKNENQIVPSKDTLPSETGRFDDSDVPGRMETPWSMAKANIPDMDKVKFKGHAITNDTVTLTLMSSADKVFMSINKKQIYKGINQRGIHIVVLNQYSGRVMAKKVFDTFQKGVEEDMVDFIDDINRGRIIVLAVLDEISSSLTWKGRSKLKELGSRFSEKISYRDMWALVTRKDGLKIAETFSNVATADTGYEWGGPIFMRTDFDLEEHPVECQWPYNERNQARRLFCVRYEGYGQLCNCDVKYWDDIFFEVNKKLDTELSSSSLYNDLGVIILATNRSHSLYKTLKSLHEAPGFNKELVAIYAEWPTREVLSLAKLFGVTVVETVNYRNTSVPVKIRHKMQRVLRDIFGATFEPSNVPTGGLPDDVIPPFSANNVIIVEEDIVVAIDIFKYFHAVYPVLEKDESILAISAFNHHGYREVVDSHSSFYRTNELQALVLLLPSRTVKKVLVPNWPSLDDQELEWFNGLEVAMKNDQDLIYPEITRAKHSSYEGYVIEGPVQDFYFKDHMLSITTEYEIPQKEVDRLILSEYRKEMKDLLKKSEELEFDFCEHDLGFGKNPLVLYIEYDGKNDTNWSYVMKCLKTWSGYTLGGWKGVWQIKFHGHQLSFVGVPISPFSSFKSQEYKLITAPPNSTITTPDPTQTRRKK